MKFIELFAGIGGFSLGFERAGMECVGHVEIDSYAQNVLRNHWPKVKIYGDIKKLKGLEFGQIDLICGGWPCQPFSTAGKQKGRGDHRDLWPEMCRIIQIAKPTWVIGENVANFTNMEFARTKSDLEKIGYEVGPPLIIPACAVGAPHLRRRAWIMAHTDKGRSASRHKQKRQEKGPNAIGCSAGPDVANSRSSRSSEQCRLRQRPAHGDPYLSSLQGPRAWAVEPSMGRVATRISSRVDRLRCLGNSLVPQIPEIIGNFIMEVENG